MRSHNPRPLSILLTAGLLTSACKPTPSISPAVVDDQRRAHAATRSARTDLKNAERVEAERRAEFERLEARQDETDDAEAQRRAALRRAADEHARYQATLERIESLRQDCREGERPEDVKDLYRYLASFESTPERDRAITLLEPCRRTLVKSAKKDIRESARLLRAAFAEEVEDTFDDNNPFSKGGLTAIVNGDTLLIRMRGTYEGRKRHSQEQVESWCSQSKLFSKITLRNAHGTFTCDPGGESMKEIERSILAEEGLLPPWAPPTPGSEPTPSPAGSLPPPPKRDPEEPLLAQQSATLRADWDAALADVERRRDAITSAEATQSRLDRQVEDANLALRQALESSARRAQIGGLAIGGLGLLSTSVGAYLVYRRIGVRDEIDSTPDFDVFGQAIDSSELEAKSERLTTGIRIGLGLGLPLIATGALLLLLGSRRNDQGKSLALAPGGLVLRF